MPHLSPRITNVYLQRRCPSNNMRALPVCLFASVQPMASASPRSLLEEMPPNLTWDQCSNVAVAEDQYQWSTIRCGLAASFFLILSHHPNKTPTLRASSAWKVQPRVNHLLYPKCPSNRPSFGDRRHISEVYVTDVRFCTPHTYRLYGFRQFSTATLLSV